MFGGLFVLQGILFIAERFIHVQRFEFHADARGITGAIFVVFALVVYPVIGYYNGHVYPSQPTFGLPCPTTIFTFGILLLATRRLSWYFFAVPLIWSVIGFSAAFQFGVYEDVALIISAVFFCFFEFVAYGSEKKSVRINSTLKQPLHDSNN